MACMLTLERGHRLVMSIETIEENPGDRDEDWRRVGVGGGLSERDSVSRQRYIENSGLSSAVSQTLSVASQPIDPKYSSSHELCHFIQEQRKIISTFRAQPWPMQVKLAALRSYKRNLSKYVHHLNTIDTFRDSSGLVLKRFKRRWRTIKQYLTVWGTIIKKIEGNFGTSVASFFTFLRWLCALNLILTFLVIFFLLLPQLVVGHGLEVPDSIKGNVSAVSFIIDGKGYAFEYSVLFYGYYDSGQNEPYVSPPANPDPFIGFNYKLPLAYLLVSVGLFVYCGVAILSNMAKKLKLLERANVSEHYLFSWKVFVSWDYAITEPSTANGKRKQIAMSLKETIMEAKKKEDTGINVRYWIARAITNCTIFIFLVGSSYAIFLAVENAENTGANENRDIEGAFTRGWNGIWQLILSFQVQIVIVARNFLLPILFRIAQICERFHPRTALKMMLVRMFVLYFSSLYVLVIALFTISNKCGGDNQSVHCCWETTIGQELYKLTFTHLLADWANIVLLDGGRWLLSRMTCRCCSKWNKFYNKWVGPAEFQLANNVLKLVYGQALILFGVLFCPVLVAIGLVKNIILFYCRGGAVYFFNKPPRTLFRIASTRNFYMGLLLVTVFMCALPVGYAVVELVPSLNCGPFRGLPNMLHVVVNEIATWPEFLQTVFGYVQRPTVIVPFVALLCIMIYYYAGHSNALKEVNKDLRLQLRVEQNETRQRVAREAVAETTGERQAHNIQTQRHKELQQAIQAELKQRLQQEIANDKKTETSVDEDTSNYTDVNTHALHAYPGTGYPSDGGGSDLLSREGELGDGYKRQRARRMSVRQRPELPWAVGPRQTHTEK